MDDDIHANVPAPSSSRTRSVDDLLQPGTDELLLSAMVQLAILEVGEHPAAGRDAHAFLAQLKRKGLPTEGLRAFAEDLFDDPSGWAWRRKLQKQLDDVPRSRCRIWLALQTVWGIDDEPVWGKQMRRIDAILDIAEFPGSALDVQTGADAYATIIAEAKLGAQAKIGLGLGAAAIGAGLGNAMGGPVGGAGMGIRGWKYLRDRITAIDADARALAEVVVAARAAGFDQDGLDDVARLSRGLQADLSAVASRSPTLRANSDAAAQGNRAAMIESALGLVHDFRSRMPR